MIPAKTRPGRYLPPRRLMPFGERECIEDRYQVEDAAPHQEDSIGYTQDKFNEK